MLLISAAPSKDNDAILTSTAAYKITSGVNICKKFTIFHNVRHILMAAEVEIFFGQRWLNLFPWKKLARTSVKILIIMFFIFSTNTSYTFDIFLGSEIRVVLVVRSLDTCSNRSSRSIGYGNTQFCRLSCVIIIIIIIAGEPLTGA